MTYPTPADILTELGLDAIVVGSACNKPLEQCKDLDLRVSDDGLKRLTDKYGYWLVSGGPSTGWMLFLPEEDGQVIEIFNGIVDLPDDDKFLAQQFYEEVILMPLKTITIHGVEMLALA